VWSSEQKLAELEQKLDVLHTEDLSVRCSSAGPGLTRAPLPLDSPSRLTRWSSVSPVSSPSTVDEDFSKTSRELVFSEDDKGLIMTVSSHVKLERLGVRDHSSFTVPSFSTASRRQDDRRYSGEDISVAKSSATA
jgi:hypothetical protein